MRGTSGEQGPFNVIGVLIATTTFPELGSALCAPVYCNFLLAFNRECYADVIPVAMRLEIV